MKKILLIAFLTACINVAAQKKIAVTEQFTIEGLVKQPLTIKLNDLNAYQLHSIDSIIITNHLHEQKSVLHNVKTVLLKDILNKISLDEANPRLLSEFYFTCIASDGYKVLFSWNELFNAEAGNSVGIIVARDGKELPDLNDRIALISPADFATGRRYVKSLQKIIVSRIQ